MFHRLTVPTYFGGLVTGADYLNTPSDPTVGGSGTPASVDGVKVGGPNDGTYFNAFGDDATSAYMNRGLFALGQNTDALDDYLHRDIAVPVRTASVTAGSAITTIAITGQIFIGASGTVNNQVNRDALFSVLDSNGNEIISVPGGSSVQVGLVHDGSNNNVVGTTASGFRSGVTLTLTAAIPSGTSYYVVYGERGNLAALPVDALTSVKVRSAQEVSAEVERLLLTLHGTTAYQFTWNDAWPVTLNGLLRGGLNARYRNSSVDPGWTVDADTPGAGSTITRDGAAINMVCPNTSWADMGVGRAYAPDPLLACFRVRRSSPASSPVHSLLGGDAGLVQESPYNHTMDHANERGFGSHRTGPLLLDTLYNNFGAATVMGGHLLTKISTENVALLNPDGLGEAQDSAARATVEVHSSDFLRYNGATAIRAVDLIEVINNATGAVIGTYRVYSILSDRRMVLSTVGGYGAPPVSANATTTAVRLRWLQPTLSLGGNHRDPYGAAVPSPHFLVTQPPVVLSTVNDTVNPQPAAMYLSAVDTLSWGSQVVTVESLLSAMAWGGFTPTGAVSVKGLLQGDGGIQCSGGRQRLPLVNRGTPWTVPVTATGAVPLTYPYGPSRSNIELYTNADVATAITINPQYGLGYDPVLGDEFDLAVHIEPGSAGPLSLVWPANFHFSGSDAVVPTANASGSLYTILYRFKYMDVNGSPRWYATRTDFNS